MDSDGVDENPIFSIVAQSHRVRGRAVVGVIFPQFLALLCRVLCDLYGDIQPQKRIADLLTSTEKVSVSPQELAKEFSIPVSEAAIFLAWIQVGLGFKTEFIDPHKQM